MVTASNRRKRRDEGRGNLAYQSSERAECKFLLSPSLYADDCCKKSLLKSDFSRKITINERLVEATTY